MRILSLGLAVVFCLSIGITNAQNISDEAMRYFDRGQAAVEMAKTQADYEDAIKEFEKAAKLAPEWPDVYYNLGLIQEKIGKYSDAIKNLTKYLELSPNASDSREVKKFIAKIEYKMEKALEAAKIRNWWKLSSYSLLEGPLLKFYESGYNGISKDQRDYKTQFSKRTSRYIYWELNLSHPAPGRQIDFKIEAKWYKPNGSLLTREMSNSYVKSGWTWSYHNNGWGWETRDNWQRGKYRVELYIEGEKVTSGSFEVVR
jgi:tetratricopeptide (TPR) repeat protein